MTQNHVRVLQKCTETATYWHVVRTTAQTLRPFFNASSTIHRKKVATENMMYRSNHANKAAAYGREEEILYIAMSLNFNNLQASQKHLRVCGNASCPFNRVWPFPSTN